MKNNTLLMSGLRKIHSAFISVWNKEALDGIVEAIAAYDIQIFSTGGTAGFIEKMAVPVTRVENLTGYPSILGGRVKTLHPKIFGGILARRDNQEDMKELGNYEIPLVDLVIVDLYPFEQTLESGAPQEEIIEKIDIGGISLIRAAAKNFNDVLIIPSRDHYPDLLNILHQGAGHTSLEERRRLASEAFMVSAGYDKAIHNYFIDSKATESFSMKFENGKKLRYGENPHQDGFYYGELPFLQLHGKEISYNNILDIDAASGLISEFDEMIFAVLKHNNACGISSRNTLKHSWLDALAGDPVSAFGGVLATNREVDEETAVELDKLFFEVIIAPGYGDKALSILKQKKNRIILAGNNIKPSSQLVRSVTGGILVQDRDNRTESDEDLKVVTELSPGNGEIADLIFANKIVKHSKSNAIVLVKNSQLLGSGVGQTSRIDALRQAVEKARSSGFVLEGAIMASDAFFPFADSVEIAHKEGIKAIIQPGGSVRDKESIDFCNKNGMKMVFTGIRHFKH
jgi:phosphoribosylaminoimidazolecarboxamide formyltransferase / IMP cyclohydrolase